MALPSFFKRNDTKTAAPVGPPADDAGPVHAARTRARRRLIGAVVLLAIGVIGFPMLFETQPRPLPDDTPIEMPRRDGQAPRLAPAPRSTPTVVEAPTASPVASAGADETVVTVSPASAPAAVPVDSAVAASKPAATAVLQARPPAARPEATRAAEARPAPAAAAVDPTPEAVDARAGRFVVQVGAYTDANTLRDVRSKVEKLGLKTYTQSIETDAGKRTRVRVGPFATRLEADSASSKLKGAGLPGNVLVL